MCTICDLLPYGECDYHKEHRLEREARERCLGRLKHHELIEGEPTADALVEVSYEEHGEEHAGYYLVTVPSREPTGNDDEDLANHPATLASDTVYTKLTREAQYKGWTYHSVDDVFPW